MNREIYFVDTDIFKMSILLILTYIQQHSTQNPSRIFYKNLQVNSKLYMESKGTRIVKTILEEILKHNTHYLIASNSSHDSSEGVISTNGVRRTQK
jgi:hypothetical protein